MYQQARQYEIEKTKVYDAMKDKMNELHVDGQVVLHNPEFIPFSSTRQMIYRYGLSIGLKLKIKHRNGEITVSVCDCSSDSAIV